MKKYDHGKIEPKWQAEWEKDGLYHAKDEIEGRVNFFQLVEFPYPSGNLHVGHWYAFAVPDIFARAKRMQGKNVLFPIGFDAFGLPAENAAIKRDMNPRAWTYENIEYMRGQLRRMGGSFDWSREIITCDPAYYRWTQWLFLRFFKAGLVYQDEVGVNWCPSCKTVLANEQVIGGKCERCESEVDQRKMKQWMMRISEYSEKLLKGLGGLDWPGEIKESQRNWIGKSDGAEIAFSLCVPGTGQKLSDNGHGGEGSAETQALGNIKVFTTRPDTIFGATYLVIAPEHKALAKLSKVIKNHDEVVKYIDRARKKTELERMVAGKSKDGVVLAGVAAVNPATLEEIPVFVADYVLSSVGTGAIMAVPAHDERDFEFAKKFHLPIRRVIEPPNLVYESAAGAAVFGRLEHGLQTDCWVGDGVLTNSGDFNGLQSNDVRWDMAKAVGGKRSVRYRLRDWVISRQRYWGVPIPIVYCHKCKAVPAADSDLPVLLPEISDYKPRDDGRSPLSKAEDWVRVRCPQCGGEAERETDTMDTFVDSSWYFLRYTDPHNDSEFAALKKIKNWLPVDRYSGGAEHTTMHLLYSRFWIKAMHDLGLLDFTEPYLVRMNRGLIMGPDGQKMSKSRGNVVDPDDIVDKLGADTVRMYLAFIGPYNEVGSYPWDPNGILGVRRFLDKAWSVIATPTKSPGKQSQKKIAAPLGNLKTRNDEKLQMLLHKTIKKVTADIENFKFNTAISQMMVLLSAMEKEESDQSSAEVFLKLLAPFAPHIAEEIWREVLGNKESIHLQMWPKHEEKFIETGTVHIPIQINGKTRATVEAAGGIGEEDLKKLALEDGLVRKYVDGKKIKKTIYVPGKIINFVI